MNIGLLTINKTNSIIYLIEERGHIMKGFFKFLVSLFALFGAAVGALAIFDKLSNKHRIKGDYLECDTQDEEIVIEDNE